MKTAQRAIQEKLAARLTEAKLKNPSFSIRGLAKRLGVSPAMLSRLLSGKRQVSRELAIQLMDKLYLPPQESQEILALFPERRRYRRALGKQGEDFVDRQAAAQLTLDQYQIVADWHHFPIRALLRTPASRLGDAARQVAWLASRLGLNTMQVKTALGRLERLEMVEQDKKGPWRATQNNYESPDGLPSVSIRSNHAQHLELAKASLERDPVECRDFTNLNLTLNPKKLPQARELIRRFRSEMEDLLESEPIARRNEVYSLAIQLFPLSVIQESRRMNHESLIPSLHALPLRDDRLDGGTRPGRPTATGTPR